MNTEEINRSLLNKIVEAKDMDPIGFHSLVSDFLFTLQFVSELKGRMGIQEKYDSLIKENEKANWRIGELEMLLEKSTAAPTTAAAPKTITGKDALDAINRGCVLKYPSKDEFIALSVILPPHFYQNFNSLDRAIKSADEYVGKFTCKGVNFGEMVIVYDPDKHSPKP